MALLATANCAHSALPRNLTTKRTAPQVCRAAPAPTVPNEGALPAGGPGAKYAAGQCTKVSGWLQLPYLQPDFCSAWRAEDNSADTKLV
eukprot:133472-Pelagomonas_calceolata.AAC.1